MVSSLTGTCRIFIESQILTILESLLRTVPVSILVVTGMLAALEVLKVLLPIVEKVQIPISHKTFQTGIQVVRLFAKI